jgi:hypothetical protein
MKVSGFTFLRNAVKMDYPAVEAITGVLPLVDEFVVNIGRLEGEACDGTMDLVKGIGSPKIRIVESLWNPNCKDGGYVYAQQTNIALMNCTGDWAIYVQCDEIIHEEDYPILEDAMACYLDEPGVDALSNNQLCVWGNYDTILAYRPHIGRRKCWVVKPHHFVLSRGDAAGFTVHPKYKEKGRKIRGVETAARQFHYTSITSLEALQEKLANSSQFWKGREANLETITDDIFYNRYTRDFFLPYKGTHPAVMKERIARHNSAFDLESPRMRKTPGKEERKLRLLTWLVDRTHERFFINRDYKLVGTHSKPVDVRILAKG